MLLGSGGTLRLHFVRSEAHLPADIGARSGERRVVSRCINVSAARDGDARKGHRMSMSKVKLGVAMAAVVALSAAAIMTAESAAAGKPGGGGASIALNESDPHLGDWVTFTTSGRGSNVQVACYGAGMEIIWSSKQPVGSSFLLGGTSSLWIDRGGGSADCYAWLIGRDMSKVYAMTAFTSAGWR